MEFGEQEGEEGCFRKEAKEARDQGFSDRIRGRAGEVRSRSGVPRELGGGRLREFQGPAGFEGRI